MDDNPLVYIVILNWNKNEQTLDCLRSVFESTYTNFRVVVIDNAPVIRLHDMLNKEFPTVDYIHNQANLGFTGGCNQGIDHAMNAGADFIWLLNNDTVVSKDCLSLLVEEASSNPMIGLLSPIIENIHHPDSPYFGTYFNIVQPFLINSHDIATYKKWEQNEGDKICLWGTALLINKNLVNVIGNLDNTYFAYYEDIDYSIRSIRSGFINRTCLITRIKHGCRLNSIDEKKEHWYFLMARNHYLFLRKSGISRAESIFRTLYLYLPKVSALYKEGKLIVLKPMIAGLWQGIVLNRFGPPPEKFAPPWLVYAGSVVLSRPLYILLPKLRWVIMTGQRVFRKVAKILRGR